MKNTVSDNSFIEGGEAIMEESKIYVCFYDLPVGKSMLNTLLKHAQQ